MVVRERGTSRSGNGNGVRGSLSLRFKQMRDTQMLRVVSELDHGMNGGHHSLRILSDDMSFLYSCAAMFHSVCASAASARVSQNTISMVWYSSTAAESSERACTNRPFW